MDERLARLCLATITEPGHPAMAAAVSEFPAAEVWAGLLAGPDGPLARRAHAVDPDELLARTRACQQRFLVPGDEEWPSGLAALAGCEPVAQLSGEPLGLWVRGAGHLGELTSSAVAIVGARASTAYGDTVAAELAAGLSEAGRTVVSGGAYGIDAAAHRGALAGSTPTVAVLAGGLDQPYPSGHGALFGRIAEHGVLVSERPPGEHPTRVRFNTRRSILCLSPQRSGGTAGHSPRGTWPVELGSRSPQLVEGQAASGGREECPPDSSQLHSGSPPRGRERHRHDSPGHGQPYGLAREPTTESTRHG